MTDRRWQLCNCVFNNKLWSGVIKCFLVYSFFWHCISLWGVLRGRWYHWKLNLKGFWNWLCTCAVTRTKMTKKERNALVCVCSWQMDVSVKGKSWWCGKKSRRGARKKRKWQTGNEEAITGKNENFSLHECLCELNHRILQNRLYVSCLKEQPTGFFTVFPEVRLMVQCQELCFCWAFHMFLGWHKTADNKYLQASWSC